MALTETRPQTEGTPDGSPDRPVPGPLERLIGSGDHTSIGRLFIGFSLILTLLALVTRAVVGADVATDNGFLGGRTTMLGTSSLVALVLIGVVPALLGLAVSVVPLQVGSPAIAFPRAVALSLWTWLVAAGIFITSVAINGGVLGTDTNAAKLGNVSMGAMMVALGLGSVCVATTVVAHRPFGMGLPRVPFFSWSMLVGAVLWILTLASAFAHVIVGQISQADAGGLATNFTQGIGWLTRGPSIYMIAIPVLGIAADVAATASQRRITQYGIVQGIIGAYAVLSFGAWAQLPRSINTVVWTVFALAIAVPVIGLLGALADVLRRGKVQTSPALVLSLLSVLLLLGSVLAGLLQALDLAGKGTLFGFNAAALGAAQSAFVVSAALGGALAGLFHWSPLVWGGPVRSGAGNATAALVFLGGGLLATGQLVQAVVQLDGKDTAGQLFGGLAALGALLLAVGVLSGFLASLGAARDAADGDGADDDVAGLTLEWAFPTPAVGGVAPDLPEVSSPYPLLDAREGSTKETS
jgi:heme/copper-type cytochrome/quinol oxidase subunit 1